MHFLDRTQILIDNPAATNDDMDEYEQLYHLYWDKGKEDVMHRMHELFNKIYHPGKEGVLISNIEEAIKLASDLSRIETDRYAQCVESLFVALATVK